MEQFEGVRSRREFIRTGGFAAAGIALAGGQAAHAAEGSAPAETEQEKANVKLINDFCAAWATLDSAKLGEFFADDAVFRMNEKTPPAVGRETITGRLKAFLGMAKEAEFVVIRTHAIGNIVLNERYDKFKMAGRDSSFHMSGVFFIKNGKIAEWNDYGMPKGA